eukprot:scaffold17_cov187-Ochromonas_danica.AAC.9
MSDNTFIADRSGSVCAGYLDLTHKTEVKAKMVDRAGGQKRFGMMIKDGYANVSFFLDSGEVRDQWLEILRQAIAGTCHVLSSKTLIIPALHFGSPEGNGGGGGAGVGSTGEQSNTVDFPRKIGYLKKTSRGQATFGIKSVKKRFFRLEAGELRYYEDDDVRASRLKGVISLAGAQLAAGPGQMLSLHLSSGRHLRLEASSGKEALEWCDAFGETLALLALQKQSSNDIVKKSRRRFNLHERLSPEQKRALKTKNQIKSQLTPSRGRSLSFFASMTSGSSSPPPPPLSPTSGNNSPVPSGGSLPGTPLATHRLSRTALSFSIGSSAPSSNDNAVPNVLKSPAVTDLLKNALNEHFLLAHMSLDLVPVVETMAERLVGPGEVILWQGASGDTLYVVESGQCEVIRDGVRIGHVFPGKAFGEMALLSNTVRQATVRACQPSRLWCLTRQAVRQLAAQQEVHKLEEKLQLIRGIDLFEKLSAPAMEKIADVLTIQQFSAGERIIKQGEVGDRFYIIISGRVSITQTQGLVASSTVELVKLGPGKYFGEKALMEDSPRKATVTAITSVSCYTLDRVSFLSLFGSMEDIVQESVGVSMLKKVSILSSLSDSQLSTIARRLSSKQFIEGEIIIKQGDVGDSFYMLIEGAVSIQVNHITVATLEPGTFFGEMALLSNEKRSATVSAVCDTTCLVLSRNDFNDLLGPLDEIIAAGEKRKAELQERAMRRKSASGLLMNQLKHFSNGLFNPASPTATSRKGRSSSVGIGEANALFAQTQEMFTLDHLDKLRKLAQGTFGNVYLVQHFYTSKYYAMKTIYKDRLLDTMTESTAVREKEIMLLLSDQLYAPALYATLQDERCLHFVMHYLPGGDLWTLLYGHRLSRTKLGGVSTHIALFYAANVLAAMQHMHSIDVIHRDIKPENLMIDASGYIKIVDYGCAKVVPLTEKTQTLCGTAEYLAPEMILSRPYNRSVDFWGLGILLFELLTRSTPFAHTNMAMLFQHILDCGEVMKTFFDTSPSFDGPAKTTLTGLLSYNPSTRLGVLHGGINDIWASPFFQNISFESIEKRQLSPPYMNDSPSSDDMAIDPSSAKTLGEALDCIEVPIDDMDEVPVYEGNFDYSLF